MQTHSGEQASNSTTGTSGPSLELPIEPDIRSFLQTKDRVRVGKGEFVMLAKQRASHVFLVESGLVELRRPDDSRQIVLAVLGPGGVFGDVPVLLKQRHHLDAVATQDSELLSVPSDDFLYALRSCPELATSWMASLAARIVETHERLIETLAGHLDYRIAAVIARRANASGQVDITHSQLARLLGVQRSSVSDVVRRLELRQLVRQGYGHITVIDSVGLAALVAD